MSITILGITVTAGAIGAVIHYGSREIEQRYNHWKDKRKKKKKGAIR